MASRMVPIDDMRFELTERGRYMVTLRSLFILCISIVTRNFTNIWASISEASAVISFLNS